MRISQGKKFKFRFKKRKQIKFLCFFLSLESQNQALLGTLGSIPSSSTRRVRQTILLAQKLLKTEKECEELREHLENAQELLSCRDKELVSAKSTLAKTQQPYNYLVEAIESREIEVEEARTRVKVLENELSGSRSRCSQLETQIEELQYAIEEFVEQKDELDKLKEQVIQMARGRQEESKHLRQV